LLGAAWSYGDELGLDIASEGHGAPDGSPGEWSITTRASRWLLLSPSRLIAHDRDPKDSELPFFGALEGTTIRAAEARFEDYALTVTLSNDYRFVILTNRRRRMKYSDLALWRLYAPHHVIASATWLGMERLSSPRSGRTRPSCPRRGQARG